MKVIFKIAIFTSFLFAFIACSNDGEVRQLNVSAVKALYEPSNGREIVLQASASATLFFSWEPAVAEDGGMVMYEIAFDKTSGDFSTPVFMIASDKNGSVSSATLTHKQLNQIAALSGVESAQKGTLKWTVFSSKGFNPVKAEKEQTITVTRLPGLADIPDKLYVTGEASEGGADLSKAHKMKTVADGEYEVYTKLAGGKQFYFVADTKGTPKRFSTANGKILTDGTSTVTTEGVYRITMDFTTGACTYTLITRIGFFFCPSNAILFDLPYVGNGVFQAKDKTVTFKQESWGRDERYKFRMFEKGNAGADAERQVEWVTLNQTDSRPTASSPATYYYLRLLSSLSQWDNKWKLMGDFDDVPATYTILLQADLPYTHSINK